MRILPMSFLYCCVLLLTIVDYGNGSGEEEDENANKLFDLIIPSLKKYTGDSFDVEDVTLPLIHQGHVEANVMLSNINLKGIRKLQREGDAFIDGDLSHLFHLNATVRFAKLKFAFDFKIMLRKKSWEVAAQGKGDGSMLGLTVAVKADVEPKNKTFELKSIILKSTRSINMKIQKYDIFDKIINPTIKLFTKNFKDIALTLANKQLQSAIKIKISYVGPDDDKNESNEEI